MLLNISGKKKLTAKNKNKQTNKKKMREGETAEHGQATKCWILTLFRCRGIKNAPMAEAYLELSRTFTMEFFGETS